MKITNFSHTLTVLCQVPSDQFLLQREGLPLYPCITISNHTTEAIPLLFIFFFFCKKESMNDTDVTTFRCDLRKNPCSCVSETSCPEFHVYKKIEAGQELSEISVLKSKDVNI